MTDAGRWFSAGAGPGRLGAFGASSAPSGAGKPAGAGGGEGGGGLWGAFMGRIGAGGGSGAAEGGGDTGKSSSSSSSSSWFSFGETQDDWTCGLTQTQRLQGFVLLLLASAVLFGMAVLFFPMALLMPAKFATSFTFGSLCFMGAFLVWRGVRPSLIQLLDPERLPFTAAYLLSIAGTLYAALFAQSYLLVMVSSVVQIGALLWYGATFIPGGRAGMSFVSGMLWSVTRTIVKTLCGFCSGGAATAAEAASAGSSSWV